MIPDTNLVQLCLAIVWIGAIAGYVFGFVRHGRRWCHYHSFYEWYTTHQDADGLAYTIRANMWARDEWRRAVLKALMVGIGLNRLAVVVERAQYRDRLLNLVDLDLISLILYIAILFWLTGWTHQADRDRKREIDADHPLVEC